MRANQFSLKDLFLGTTMIAVGFGIAVLPFSTIVWDEMWFFRLVPQGLWLGGGALIGAGLLLPYKKAAIGAVIGFVVQVLFFYSYFVPLF